MLVSWRWEAHAQPLKIQCSKQTSVDILVAALAVAIGKGIDEWFQRLPGFLGDFVFLEGLQ
jgi:hypothetical protein